MAESIFQSLSPELLQAITALLQNPGVWGSLLGALGAGSKAPPAAEPSPPAEEEAVQAMASPHLPPPPALPQAKPHPAGTPWERKCQLLKAVKPFLDPGKQHTVDNALRIAEVMLLLRHPD